MKGLGERIKLLRGKSKLTLVELGKRTGIDQATLSRIENGKMTGTLDSHMRIAAAFSLTLPDLYKDILAKHAETQDRKAKQKLETFSHSSGAIAELLTTGILQKKMVPILLKIKSRGHTETEEYPAGTERFVYVLKGSLEIRLPEGPIALGAGESFYFNAAQPHNLKNSAKTEAACLSVMTPASL